MGIDVVIAFAQMAHTGQMRRGGEEPYINHPLRVYGELVEKGYTGDVLVVAILHDVVEDTSYGFDDCYQFIESEEGKEALRLVTKMEGESSSAALVRVLEGDNQIALLVKAYDSLDNARMTKHGIEFTRTVLGLDPEQEAKKYQTKAKACFGVLAYWANISR